MRLVHHDGLHDVTPVAVSIESMEPLESHSLEGPNGRGSRSVPPVVDAGKAGTHGPNGTFGPSPADDERRGWTHQPRRERPCRSRIGPTTARRPRIAPPTLVRSSF